MGLTAADKYKELLESLTNATKLDKITWFRQPARDDCYAARINSYVVFVAPARYLQRLFVLRNQEGVDILVLDDEICGQLYQEVRRQVEGTDEAVDEILEYLKGL